MACPSGLSGTPSSWHLSQERAWGSGKDVGAGVLGLILRLISRSTPAPHPACLLPASLPLRASASSCVKWESQLSSPPNRMAVRIKRGHRCKNILQTANMVQLSVLRNAFQVACYSIGPILTQLRSRKYVWFVDKIHGLI